MNNKILVTRSSMPTLEEYMNEIAPMWESHWLTNMGPKHKELQAKLCEYLDVENIDLLTNGHMALELTLQAMNLQGEVITTPFTFASTTHAIVRNGLTPVFCDIDPETYCIDAGKIEGLITDKTCAIMPVHVYGNICNIEEIERIAHKYELKVIYDAAHTFGETYQGRGIGSFGDVSCFSFHATKVFNSIEGGAVCYKDQQLGEKLYELKNLEEIEFVHGCGKRKTTLQKSIEKLEEYLLKFKEYNKKVHTCRNRNSYSKTDVDATFMRMKEDAMKNGQLKPAYDVQFGVDSEYIVWASVGPQPTDTTTLIPFLKSIEKHTGFKYSKVIADSGYESEEKYVFLEDNQQLSFLKTSDYEIKKTKKYRNDIGRKENMIYCEKDDYYICKNNKKLYVSGTINRKSKTEYKSKITCYTCEDCSNCEYKKKCIKGNNSKIPIEQRTKNLQVSKLFHKKQKENLERITNPEGRKLRMNRSIQAEGAFAQVKQNMQFKRFLSRGNKNVLSDGVYFYILKVNFLYKTLKNTLNLS